MKVLGIDIGLTGGMVLIEDSRIVGMKVMPSSTFSQKKSRAIKKNEANPTGKKTKTYLAKVTQLDYVKLCAALDYFVELGVDKTYVELVHAKPEEGVSSTFKFGTCYGAVLALLTDKEMPYELVTPSQWSKNVCSGVSASMEPKDRSRLVASRFFPSTNFVMAGCRKGHSGLIDAALIAYYGWRKEVNNV